MSREQAPSTDQISPQMMEEICTLLRRNRPVRTKLPPWGRVHIDRQLPFLGFYRCPPDRSDPGVERSS